MRILIIGQYFWPENFRINDLVKSLIEKGIQVDVLTGKPNYPEGLIHSGYSFWGCQICQWGGASVYRVPLIPRGKKGAFRLAINYLSFVFFGILFGPWLLRSRRYDAIFVYALSPIFQAIPALLIGRLKKSPVIIWVQDLWPESLKATGYIKNPFLLKKIAWIVRLIYKRADLILVQSRAFIPYINTLEPNKSTIYYPNSVDNLFLMTAPSGTPTEIPQLDQVFSIVFAGNIGTAQAVNVIVEAANLLRDNSAICFVVIGQGSRREWMQQQVEILGLKNLHLPGRFAMEAMPGIMQKAGALLVSLTDEPIFAATVPNKVQAYMASGRPIIASLNGEGARLVTEAGAGLTCAAGDAKALAAAALKLFHMTTAERAILGANGRRYFEREFDHNMLTNQLISHFKRASHFYRENL